LPELPHVVLVPRGGHAAVPVHKGALEFTVCDEAIDWLHEQRLNELQWDWDIKRDKTGRHTHMVFEFADPHIAMVFKLRWGGL
jgi:hypothetical protein